MFYTRSISQFIYVKSKSCTNYLKAFIHLLVLNGPSCEVAGIYKDNLTSVNSLPQGIVATSTVSRILWTFLK